MARVTYPKATSDDEARFLMISDAWMQQTGNLIDCDLQVKNLFKWEAQHLEIGHETRGSVNAVGK